MMKKSIRATIYLLCLMAMLTFIVGCGSSGGGDDPAPAANPTAEVKISALQFGESTIFSVTVKSVTGVTDATSFNLIGEETRPNTGLNAIADNFVLNKTTIPLEIYDSAGTVIASATLDATNYTTTFEGTLTLSSASQSLALASNISSLKDRSSGAFDFEIPENARFSITQIDGLDILASGIIDNLAVGTRSIQVPLNCGPGQPGNLTPPAGEGFFIINDVIIEYYYGMANPVEFNRVLSVKFIESGRNFENMTLAFRLPNSSNVYRVRPEPFKLLTQAEVNTILGVVNTAVSAANPWDTAIAFVDLKVTQFGSTKLVETTVTSVIGDCVAGAKSFTVQEGNETPEPPKAILDEVDKNTLQSDLILYILGNEVEVRTQTLDTCGTFTPASSGGAEGTLDLWDVSKIATGATFDFQFEAFSIPDKFRVEYPVGTIQLNTGWRGDGSPPAGEVIEGPGTFEELNMFSKGSSNTVKVLVTGELSGTAWNYSIRCNDP